MIGDKKVLFFQGPKKDDAAAAPPPASDALPRITSVRLQAQFYFNMPIELSSDSFPSPQCREVFDGTLHVIGRSTAKNVYHALADNFLPVVSQIFLDAHLHPEFLHLPRLLLNGFQPGTQGASANEDGVPHMRLMRDLFSAGLIELSTAKGMCFRRIVWGHGAHVMYYDTLLAMRRQVADFARAFVINRYQINMPKAFASYSSPSSSIVTTISNFLFGKGGGSSRSDQVELNSSSSSNSSISSGVVVINSRSLVVNNEPLKVVLYTRGSSGKGRSMKQEDLLLKGLLAAGANAVLCCDFGSTTLEDQLAFAIHADVVMGMHGAALVHGIFTRHGSFSVELKTLYGWVSALFALVTDSRRGTHAQIDVRNYWVPGGHKDIDEPLVKRTIDVLIRAIHFQKEGNIGQLLTLPQKGDFITGPSAQVGALDHVLGPITSELKALCHSMVLYRHREELGSNGDDLHCVECAPYVQRRFIRA